MIYVLRDSNEKVMGKAKSMKRIKNMASALFGGLNETAMIECNKMPLMNYKGNNDTFQIVNRVLYFLCYGNEKQFQVEVNV